MAEEQSRIAAEQVPIYEKALEAQLGASGSSQSGTNEGSTIDRSASTSNTATADDNTSSKMTGTDTKERTEPLEHKPPQPADGKPSGAKGMENRDAIPTAGGKRLGEENWGESKIVPDDPGAPPHEKGISSAAGQPTEQVKDNTAKNMGGATSGPNGGKEEGKEKESVVDKIKDKLNIGKK
ncbi:uncharacterized protein RCC_03597 [Ramularia collo-cygni]|uniref:Uncharacterized protein n=1 Tax=Ramularia collo-cygni TaxID=112498 RepID=A0A2D3UX71_9PEZI|nr:uncharacterized protein RCC_03597 [Ramularia collo-cygni]CZT17760.1 uncharacterized protein RCC_03597 [Ramularia collo-cygni]